MSAPIDEQRERKRRLRRECLKRRNAIPDALSASVEALALLFDLEEYRSAETIAFYVDFRGEVRTRDAIQTALVDDRSVAVPWCADENRLQLARLESLEELAEGRYGILEPTPHLQSLPARQMPIEAVDLIVVPGVAFDLEGGRLGYGQGYYDRLLANALKSTSIVGLAFQCQVIDRVPTAEHDVPMHVVVTEKQAYRISGQ